MNFKVIGIMIAVILTAVLVMKVVFDSHKEKSATIVVSSSKTAADSVAVDSATIAMPAPAKPAPKKPTAAKQKPTETKPTKTEPVKQDSVKSEPDKQEPTKQEPTKQEPVKSKPAKQETVKQEPVAAPVVPDINKERKRKAAEADKAAREKARKTHTVPEGYADLGLPSGTVWKLTNEEGDYYTYEQAMKEYGKNLPTKAQLEELKSACRWTWNDNGYTVTGKNGNSIFLPVTGYRNCNGQVYYGTSRGHYWSSTKNDASDAWYMYFTSEKTVVSYDLRCGGRAVRLVWKE